MDEKLEQLKKQYRAIPVPPELDFIVSKAIKSRKRRNVQYKLVIGIGAAAVIFVTGLNTSPTFAKAASEVPLVGYLVHVLTFREFKIDEGTYKADLQVPAIMNLENPSIQDSLNTKYLDENKKLYTDFMAEMDRLKQNGGGHLGVNSGYVVKTDNDQLLTIGRYVVNTAGSSSTTFKYDTIDKKNQVLITLPSLFKSDRYISIISENIKVQMKNQMNDDPNKVYWVAGVPNKINTYFETIAKDQSFYINNDGKLVISFNKYEVAPGTMGMVEFTIPTNVLSNVLVSHEYIK